MYVLRGIITLYCLIICFEYIVMKTSYGWILRKSANFTVSPDFGATSSITGNIIFM